MQDGDNGAKPRRRRAGGGNSGGRTPSSTANKPRERYAALDLGTNNCRLLIAAPGGGELRIVDAFSRIVRLGEGVSVTGRLSEAAMARTLDALTVCAEKIERRGVTHMRCIATQACRGAENGAAFLDTVRERTGLALEIISTEEEARLAASGCMELIDEAASAALIFDIGGGSTELSWVVRDGETGALGVAAWASLPCGVVSLAERWGGRDIDAETYEKIVEDVRQHVIAFGDPENLVAHFEDGGAHLLGTSGTVTSIAGVHLELDRYRRELVDGLWLTADRTREVTEKLRTMSFEDRASEPCIGRERADLVVCGCAILEALIREWPATRIRVADRGLREGILADLADEARKKRKQRRRRRRRRSVKKIS